MKKILFLCSIFWFQTFFSQVSLSGNKLMKDGTSYRFSQYREVFQKQEAQNYFKKARTNKTAAELFAYTGGFGLGFGIARLLSGGNKKFTVNGQQQTVKMKGEGWGFVAAGAGLIGVGIPFVLAANKNAEKAISIENGGSAAFQPYLRLETSGGGLALSYNF